MYRHHPGRRVAAWHFAVALLIGSLMAACSTTDSPVIRMKAGKQFSVVSVMPSEFMVKVVGTLVINNWSHREPVPRWGVNRTIESLARRVLNKSRFNVAQPSAPRRDLKVARNWRGTVDVQPLIPHLQAIARAEGSSAVILVGPRTISDIYYDTNQSVSGYGVYRRTLLNTNNARTFAVVGAWLIDANSGEVLASEWSNASSRYEGGIGQDRMAPASEQQLDKVQPALSDLFAEALIQVLRLLKFF